MPDPRTDPIPVRDKPQSGEHRADQPTSAAVAKDAPVTERERELARKLMESIPFHSDLLFERLTQLFANREREVAERTVQDERVKWLEDRHRLIDSLKAEMNRAVQHAEKQVAERTRRETLEEAAEHCDFSLNGDSKWQCICGHVHKVVGINKAIEYQKSHIRALAQAPAREEKWPS